MRVDQISPDTVISLSMLSLVVFAVFFVLNIETKAKTNSIQILNNTESIERLSIKELQSNRRIYDRLNEIDRNQQYMKGQVEQINGRLKILLESTVKK